MNRSQHVFITGVSSGIGEACMRVFHAAGWRVSGVARRQEKVDALIAELGGAEAGAFGCAADVTDAESMHNACAQLAEGAPFDLVIANAGRGLDGELLELSSQDISDLFDVNIGGVHRTVLASKPHLRAGGRYQLVASVASFLPIPRMGAYCASKSALDSYGAALRMELRASGIAVTTVHPGTVSTNFFEAAPKSGGVWNWRPGSALPATTVAAKMLRAAVGRRRRRISMPWFAAVVGWLYWRIPGITEWVLARQLAAMRQQGAEQGPERGAQKGEQAGGSQKDEVNA